MEGRLEVYLIKAQGNAKWTSLEVQGLSRQDVIKRRNASLDAYYKREADEKAKAQTKLYAMDTHAVNEMSAVDRHQRKTIEKMKKNELENAQNELLGDLEEVNALDRKLATGAVKADKKVKKVDEEADKWAAKVAAETSGGHKLYGKMKDEDIFGMEDV